MKNYGGKSITYVKGFATVTNFPRNARTTTWNRHLGIWIPNFHAVCRKSSLSPEFRNYMYLGYKKKSIRIENTSLRKTGEYSDCLFEVHSIVCVRVSLWLNLCQIRARFYRMLEAIEAGSRDTVENFKRFSLEAAKVCDTLSLFCTKDVLNSKWERLHTSCALFFRWSIAGKGYSIVYSPLAHQIRE